MKMTIDDSIKYFTSMSRCYLSDYEYLYIAVETMRKYQKIEKAYKKYLNDMVTNIYADEKFIKALRGVLEDGNAD